TFTGTLGTLPTGYTYSGTTVTIEVIVSGKPVLAGTVSISGTAKVGEQLTADTSGLVWETSGQLFYQWKAGGVDVAANGTSAAYTVAADDWGKTITVTVSAEHNAGSKTSAPTTAVTGADLAGEVTITGTAKVGEELTAVTSGLTYDPSGQLFYQWTADGSDVGENDASYTVTLADYGKKLKVTVSASKNTGSVSSEETAPAAAAAIPAFGLTGMVTAPEKFQSPVSDFAATDQYTGAIAWKEEDGDDHTGEFYPNAVYKAVVTLAAKTGYTFTGVGENSFTYTSASVSNAADSGVVTITFNATANWAASDCDHFWLVGGASPTGLLIGTGDTKTKMGDAGDENPATFSWTGNLYGGDLKIAATRGGENIDWAGKWLMAGTDGARPTGSAENAVFTMDPTEDNAGADKKWKILQEGTWTITLNTGTGQVTFTKPEAITAGGAWLYGNAAPDGLDWNIAKASAMTGSEGTFTWTGMLCNGQFKILVNTDTTTPSGYVTNYIQFQALVDNTGTTGSAQDAVYVPADSSTDKKWLIWEDTTSHGLGIYTITLDTANNTITTVKVTGANDYKIWLIGDAVGGYDLNTNSKAMTTSDGVTFTYSLTVTDASKTWKFICGKTGSLTFDNPFITADSAEDVTLSGTGAAVTYNGRGSGDDKKFKVGSTGTYTVTLDLAALTATVTTP
ncbi:MAG: hypothetical protein LBR16_01905, partial [Treponema sp.]|nr:hypothetical protein [Treponema sp.]